VSLLPVIIFDDFPVWFKTLVRRYSLRQPCCCLRHAVPWGGQDHQPPLLPCHDIHDPSCFGNATAAY